MMMLAAPALQAGILQPRFLNAAGRPTAKMATDNAASSATRSP